MDGVTCGTRNILATTALTATTGFGPLNIAGNLTVAGTISSTNNIYGVTLTGTNICGNQVYSGGALVCTSFTPPTTHLTAVSGTQLLTCQDAALVDNSTNNFAITNNGGTTTTYTTVPFNY